MTEIKQQALVCFWLGLVTFSILEAKCYQVRNETNQPAQNSIALTYIALINDTDGFGVAGTVKAVLGTHGITPSFETGGGGISISVKEPEVTNAVRIIAAAPALKGRGIHIHEQFADLVQTNLLARPRVKGKLVTVAAIRGRTDLATAKLVLRELSQSNIDAAVESKNSDLQIAVDAQDTKRAVAAIWGSSELRAAGAVIREEYRFLLK